MEAYKKLIEVTNKVKGMSEAGLSYNETEALKFLKQEADSLGKLAEEVNTSLSSNDTKAALTSLVKFVARVNLLGNLLLQPAVISSLGNQTIRQSLASLIESCISFALESYLEVAKKKGDLGLKSINLSLSANPIAMSLSLGAE
jgi:hypothetical protein